MTKQEFDNLAERVLLAVAASKPDAAASHIGKHAVEITEFFVKALVSRHTDLAMKKTSLTPEEVNLLHAKEPIKAIASVRDRTNMSLKDAKDLVDKAREQLGLL